jgi:predicted DNA-binding protein (MmcQ/YjbR family)
MLDRDALDAYCLSRRAAVCEYPFGPDVKVYKVLNKVFALIPTEGEPKISLKCDPLRAVMLRETYPAISAGYHLNKRLWNTLTIDGSIPDDEVLELIDHSYDEVVKGMTKRERAELEDE